MLPADDGAAALRIRVSPALVEIAGSVSSKAHERALLQTVDRHFAGAIARHEFSADDSLPAGWGLITDLILRAVAYAREASADISESRILIRGVTDDASGWTSALARVDAALPSGMLLDVNMITVSGDETYAGLCRRQFLQLTRDNRIEFFHSGAELRGSARPTLDAIVELAIDCPDLKIRITGHTDRSGDASFNRALSRARARAVLDYLSRHGLQRERLEAVGAGSGQPVAAGTDRRARRRNRRVEFELL